MGRTLAPSAVANAIRKGDHDAELEQIELAIKNRKRNLFRPGMKVKLVNLSSSPELEGRIGEVVKVAPTRIKVGLGEKAPWGWSEGTILCPIGMLEVV